MKEPLLAWLAKTFRLQYFLDIHESKTVGKDGKWETLTLDVKIFRQILGHETLLGQRSLTTPIAKWFPGFALNEINQLEAEHIPKWWMNRCGHSGPFFLIQRSNLTFHRWR